MKKNFFTFAFSLFCFISFGQMNFVPIVPKTYYVADNAFVPISGAAITQYRISNGIYNEKGDALFYTVNGAVLNSSFSVVDYLNGGEDVTDEVIVPKPGTCNEFYIIYVNFSTPNNTALRYSTVTVNGSTVTVSQWINLIIETNHHGTIAVSKRQATGNRYLFYGSPSGIVRFLVSNGGITFQSQLTTTGVHSNELELYEGASSWQLAWAGTTSGSQPGNGNTINILPLNTSGGAPGTITTTTIGGSLSPLSKVFGIEFLSQTSIYACVAYSTANPANGIYRVTLGTSTATYMNGSQTYCYSQLERYGVGFCAFGSPNTGGFGTLGRLVGSNMGTLAGSPTLDNFNSDGYCVPRGVDGEDYNSILRGSFAAVAATWPANPCPGEVITATVTSPQNGFTYTWYQKCGTTYTALPPNGTSKTLTIMAGCSYFVRATYGIGCSSMAAPYSNVYHICDPGGNGKSITTDDAGTQVSPNPSTGMFTIYLKGDQLNERNKDENYDLKVYDMNGKQVLQQQSRAMNRIEMDMRTFLAGTYLLRIERGNKLIETKKLIIAK